MIAIPQATAQSSSAARSARDKRRWQARAESLLTQEVAFISNPAFKELDADKAWAVEPAEGSKGAPKSFNFASGQNGMPAHLERLCSAPLLTPEQERELFCRMNYFKYRANASRAALDPETATKTQVEQVEHLIDCATRVRNHIIHANVRLVISIVKQFADNRNRFDDLLSEGISCLIKAVDKFDFDRGFRFSTYATRAVRREVFRLVQRQHRDRTRYSTGSQELLSQQLNRDTEPEGVEMSWQGVDDSIRHLLSILDEREKFIVQARYGFDDLGEKPTFQRLGQLLGVSKERVRQIEQRALGKLRDMAVALRMEPAV